MPTLRNNKIVKNSIPRRSASESTTTEASTSILTRSGPVQSTMFQFVSMASPSTKDLTTKEFQPLPTPRGLRHIQEKACTTTPRSNIEPTADQQGSTSMLLTDPLYSSLVEVPAMLQSPRVISGASPPITFELLDGSLILPTNRESASEPDTSSLENSPAIPFNVSSAHFPHSRASSVDSTKNLQQAVLSAQMDALTKMTDTISHLSQILQDQKKAIETLGTMVLDAHANTNKQIGQVKQLVQENTNMTLLVEKKVVAISDHQKQDHASLLQTLKECQKISLTLNKIDSSFGKSNLASKAPHQRSSASAEHSSSTQTIIPQMINNPKTMLSNNQLTQSHQTRPPPCPALDIASNPTTSRKQQPTDVLWGLCNINNTGQTLQEDQHRSLFIKPIFYYEDHFDKHSLNITRFLDICNSIPNTRGIGRNAVTNLSFLSLGADDKDTWTKLEFCSPTMYNMIWEAQAAFIARGIDMKQMIPGLPLCSANSDELLENFYAYYTHDQLTTITNHLLEHERGRSEQGNTSRPAQEVWEQRYDRERSLYDEEEDQNDFSLSDGEIGQTDTPPPLVTQYSS